MSVNGVSDGCSRSRLLQRGPELELWDPPIRDAKRDGETYGNI